MKSITALIPILMLSGLAWAQDAQYWDNQYGTRAQMLGGTVVGGASDLSATYYNPGWIALETAPSLLLTTKAAEYYWADVSGGFAGQTQRTSSRFAASPGFLAGQFRNVLAEELVVAYTYLNKTNFEYDASTFLVEEFPDAGPGEVAWAAADGFKRSTVSEHWAGVTFARQLNSHVALGVTPFGALRSQSRRFMAGVEAFESDGQFSQVSVSEEFDYWHVRLLAKLGLALDYSPLTLGMTLTTPSVGLFGDGAVYRNDSVAGVDIDGDGTPDSYLAANRQEGLSPTFRSPLSLAVGASYRWQGTGLHFTAEWFDDLKEQWVMEPEPFTRQTTGEMSTHDLSFHGRSVLNWGVGLDTRLSRQATLFASFRSDYSALSHDSVSEILMATWDLWHASLGAHFDFLDIEFNTGLEYSFGQSTSDPGSQFTRQENHVFAGEASPVEVDYRRIKVLLGLNLPFGPKGGRAE